MPWHELDAFACRWETAGAAPCLVDHCQANYSRAVQPTANMCGIWRAWGSLIAAAPRAMKAAGEPFLYDLVNTGREVLTQLMLPT